MASTSTTVTGSTSTAQRLALTGETVQGASHICNDRSQLSSGLCSDHEQLIAVLSATVCDLCFRECVGLIQDLDHCEAAGGGNVCQLRCVEHRMFAISSKLNRFVVDFRRIVRQTIVSKRLRP